MGLHLYDRNRKAEIDQVFGHFHADVAAPDYNGAFGLTLLNPVFDLTTVRNGWRVLNWVIYIFHPQQLFIRCAEVC